MNKHTVIFFMSSTIDIGERFGCWEVLNNRGKRIPCLCHGCGTEKLIYKSSLKNGKSTSCGCQRRNEPIAAGTQFDRLTVVDGIETKGKDGQYQVLVQCSCGIQKYVNNNCLLNGLTRSCGCLQKESRRKHGKGKIPSHEYRAWIYIKRVCYDLNHPYYKIYGGCGIKVAPEWQNNFEQFERDMGLAPPGTVLYRIDLEGDFAPGNCQWIERKTHQQHIHQMAVRKIFFPQKNKEIPQPQKAKQASLIKDIQKAHASGEANVSKLAAQYGVSTAEVINLLVLY